MGWMNTRAAMPAKQQLLKTLVLAMCLLGLNAYADSQAFKLAELFEPLEGVSDISLRILQAVFGKVGGAFDTAMTGLPSPANSRLMETIFSAFNSGLLVIVGIVVSYSVLFSTIGASQDGQSMQRKDGPMGVLRVAVGTAALVPGFGGYSAIQVLMMTIVVYSVNFANYMWTQVTESYSQHQAVQSVSTATSSDSQKADAFKQVLHMGNANFISDENFLQSQCAQSKPTTITLDLLAMEACLQFSEQLSGGGGKLGYMKRYGSDCQYPVSGSTQVACYGSTDNPTSCGVVELGSDADREVLQIGQSVAQQKVQIYISSQSTWYSAEEKSLTPSGKAQFSGCNMVLAKSQGQDLSRVISSNCTLPSDDHCSCLPQTPAATNSQSYDAYNAFYGPSGRSCVNACRMSKDLDDIADSMQLKAVTLSTLSGSQPKATGCLDNAKALGWATAGQYFYCLSSMLAGNASAANAQENKKVDIRTVQGMNPLCRGSVNDASMPHTTGDNRLGRLNACCDKPLWVSYYNAIFPNAPSLDMDAFNRPFRVSWARLESKKQAEAEISRNSQTSAASNVSFLVSPSQTSQSACRSSQFIAAAGQGLINDLPSYMRTMSPATSWATIAVQVGWEAPSGVKPQKYFKSGNGKSSGYPLTFALMNSMQSIYMTLETMTGLRVFETPITDAQTYKDMSNQFNSRSNLGTFYNSWCGCLIQSFDCGQKGFSPTFNKASYQSNCGNRRVIPPLQGMGNDSGWQSWLSSMSGNANSVDFLATMQMAGCLKLSGDALATQDSDKFAYANAGLFGMSLLKNNGLATRVDPLGNVVNIGLSMLQGSVYYFTVTINQVFNTITRIAVETIAIFTAAKILVGAAVTAAQLSESGALEALASLLVAFMQGADAMGKAAFEIAKMSLELFLPLGSSIAALLFVQGVVLGVYLPFVAFFYYFFGVIGWLMSVLEAMIAAPLVALGVTHPEGHDLLGASEQSIMLIMAVFLRPVAMIMGLFFAIIVSQTVLSLINEGFLYIVSDFYANLFAANGLSVFNPLSGSQDPVLSRVVIIATLALFMMYSYVVYSVLDMAYSLIWQIPDKILKWIGGQDTGMGRQVAESANEIKQQTQGTAGQGSQAMSSATSRGVDAQVPLGHYEPPKQMRIKPRTEQSISSSSSGTQTADVSSPHGGQGQSQAGIQSASSSSAGQGQSQAGIQSASSSSAGQGQSQAGIQSASSSSAGQGQSQAGIQSASSSSAGQGQSQAGIKSTSNDPTGDAGGS